MSCTALEPPTCEVGDNAARSGRHEEAVSSLTQCLDTPWLTKESRRNALEARAWSFANTDSPMRAVADQEEAFRLKHPNEYHEWINFASYLRAADRLEDSLNAIYSAEKLGSSEPSMMTQYNLGWTLYELGRNEEAIAAFSRGIPNQPDYLFVYWRRGLAFERMGNSEEAKTDFRMVDALLKKTPLNAGSQKYLPEIRAKLDAYGIS